MKSTRRNEGAFDIIALSGEIDFHHATDLRQQIVASLDQGQHVLLDLSAVDYMDSSGIATLVQGLKHAKNKELRFDLVGVRDAVLKVLQLTRMDEVFTLHDSASDGLAIK